MSRFEWREGEVVIHELTESPRDRKRAEAVRARAAGCADACVALLAIPDVDDRVMRKMLLTLTRLATRPKWRNEIKLRSAGALDVNWADARAGGDPLHIEHVVPVRVLVERMLTCHDEPAEVFAISVLAVCRKSEHERIGPLLKNHGDVYEQMIDPTTPLSALPGLGRLRYVRAEIGLHEVA
ncbi:MAG: hypothetical protein ACT452_02505 [Microthrixaceae bacterium]